MQLHHLTEIPEGWLVKNINKSFLFFFFNLVFRELAEDKLCWKTKQ